MRDKQERINHFKVLDKLEASDFVSLNPISAFQETAVHISVCSGNKPFHFIALFYQLFGSKYPTKWLTLHVF